MVRVRLPLMRSVRVPVVLRVDVVLFLRAWVDRVLLTVDLVDRPRVVEADRLVVVVPLALANWRPKYFFMKLTNCCRVRLLAVIRSGVVLPLAIVQSTNACHISAWLLRAKDALGLVPSTGK